MVLIVIFPLISNAQWSVIGGMTLNKSKIITDNNVGSIINPGGKVLPLVITKYDFSPNVSFGLRKETIFNDKIGYNLELLYWGRSLKLPNPNSKAFTNKLLVAPVLFTYSVKNNLVLEAGPQVDFFLLKDTGYIRKLNMSGTLGLIFKTKSKLGFGLRFNKSLINNFGKESDRYKLTHSTGLVYLSYKISKK